MTVWDFDRSWVEQLSQPPLALGVREQVLSDYWHAGSL